jgi:antitoxin CcdA
MKVRTNVTLNQELLEVSKRLNINVSAVLEEALCLSIKDKQAEAWLDENLEAIALYNADVETHGVFSQLDRSF